MEKIKNWNVIVNSNSCPYKLMTSIKCCHTKMTRKHPYVGDFGTYHPECKYEICPLKIDSSTT